MKPSFLVLILMFALHALCSEIFLSKDSLWSNNTWVFGKSDTILIKNIGADSVKLDSAILTLLEIDTAGFERFIGDNTWRIYWEEKGMACIWKPALVQTNKYKLEIETESPPLNIPSLAIGPNDSTFLRRFELGFCFYCNSYPTYPRFWKGLLELYFSDNQMVEIKLYTNDLRTRILTKNARLTNRNMEKNTTSAFSVNGRICNQSHSIQMPGTIKVEYNKASGKYRVSVGGLKQ